MNEEKKSSSGIRTAKGLFVWVLVLVVMAAISLGGADQGAAEAGGLGDAVESSLPAPEAGGDMDAVGSSLPTPTPASATAGGGADPTPSPAATESVTPGGKIQSIAFKKDARIQEALLFLQERYQKNIVPSAKVDGTINVANLRDVTFEQALDAILGRDFAIETEGNIIKVYTAEEYKKILEDPDRMIYEVFTLYYITAAEGKKLLMPILSSNAKVEVTAAAEITFPTGESISTVSGGGDTSAMNDTIIVFDYPENVEEARKLLQSLDVRPKQVLVEATIMSVTLTEDMQFGIDWQTLKGTAVTGLSSITAGAEDYFKSAGTGVSNLSGGLTVGFALGDVGAFIRAVEEISDVTVLANPKILAINKQLGQVYIGKKVAYVSQITQNQSGSTTQEVQFLDTGTKLSFRPYIGDDGYIRMDIHPKDSDATLRGDLPDETSAEVVTNIIVRDGQTVVIGGLFRDTVTAVRTQVPVLGDIPIVGLLFRGKADQIKREEVIILLTPHIIEEPSQSDGAARADDVRRKRLGAKDELQWTGRGRLAEDYYAEAVGCYTEGDSEAAMKALHLSLRLRPAYLEAIRLQEKILAETDPGEAKKLERIILEDIDLKEAPKWIRR